MNATQEDWLLDLGQDVLVFPDLFFFHSPDIRAPTQRAWGTAVVSDAEFLRHPWPQGYNSSPAGQATDPEFPTCELEPTSMAIRIHTILWRRLGWRSRLAWQMAREPGPLWESCFSRDSDGGRVGCFEQLPISWAPRHRVGCRGRGRCVTGCRRQRASAYRRTSGK